MTGITPILSTYNGILIQSTGNKDALSRLKRYVFYLDTYGLEWWKPDLAAYRDYLRSQRLAESSIQAHLSTVRAKYRAVLRQRDLFYRLIPPALSVADSKSMVDEIITRIENAIHPDEARTSVIRKQDVTDREKVWLTALEVADLLNQPQNLYAANEPVGLRDAAILGLLVSTGLREAELAALNISDLYASRDGEQCLLVRRGKGTKQRLIPYGEFRLGLELTERWLGFLGAQGVTDPEQPVFWSFWKDRQSLRGRLSTRRIGDIIGSYWIRRGDVELTFAPHDLRRTYARLQYLAGMDLLRISQNMGHTSVEVTKGYVGELNIEHRRNRKIF